MYSYFYWSYFGGMIKNFIFDMGGVLIEWSPIEFIKRLGVNDKDIDLIYESTVKKPYWHEYDLGQINKEELYQKCLNHLPVRLHKIAKEFIGNWSSVSKEIEGMNEYCLSLKQKGYKLYMLTNAGKNQVYYIRNYPYKYFDGKCVSAHYGVGKPDKEFYEILLKKYNLNRDECIFVDDVLENVLGAEKIGIKAIQFKSVEQLRKEVSKLL